jgi:NADPH2 dehydrogenase
MVEEILSNNRADLVALGRELLRNPFWVLNCAKEKKGSITLPKQYERAFPME